MADRRSSHIDTPFLNVTGQAIISDLIVPGSGTFGDLAVTGTFTPSGPIVLPGTISVNTIQNETVGGGLTLQTQTNNANISLNPNGTGAVAIASGKNLLVDNIRAVGGGALRLLTASGTNGNITLIPDGTGNVGISASGGLSVALLGTIVNSALDIRTNGTTRLTVPAAGIAGGSSLTALTLNGTNIESNTIVTPTSSQALSNKTIDSASNTLTVNSTNVNSLINQDVRSSAGPTFASVTTANIGTAGASDFQILTNSTTRFFIPSTGIPSNSSSVNLMTLNAGTNPETRTIASLSTSTAGNVTWTGYTSPPTTGYAIETLFNGSTTIRINSFTATLAASTTIIAAGIVPIASRPPANCILFCTVNVNGSLLPGLAQVYSSNGDIEFFASQTGGSFTGGLTGGSFGNIQLTWGSF